jgi:3-hydroxymyristoyl/3-hydroxydecanoyl-(acyl carrier protein) dehydratase
LGLPCAVTDLIPQKGKMGFNQILTKTNGDAGQSTAIIKADQLFLDDRQQLSNMALIEYVNQLIAAAQGYKEAANHEPVKKGLFVGLQEAEFLRPVYLGDSLTLKKFLAEEVPPVNFVQGIIERNGEQIAAFITKIYEVANLAEFNLVTNQGSALSGKNGLRLNNQKPPAYLASRMHRTLFSYLHDVIIDADGIAFKIVCPADFEAFDGHFPGNPILPGIILLEIAQLALKLFVKQPVVVKSIKKMKIGSMVLPNQVISGALKIEDPNHGSRRSFTAVFKTEHEREISRFSGSCEEGKGHYDEA